MKTHFFDFMQKVINNKLHQLRRAAELGKTECGTDAKDFVLCNFNVDDGLTSVPTEREATELLKRTNAMLSKSNLNLHKVATELR